jgi:cytochrome c2
MIRVAAAIVAAVLAAAVWWSLLVEGSLERRRQVDAAVAVTGGGRPERGREVVRSYGCGACHEISGISEARGRVGPSLVHLRERTVLAGVVANSAGDLVAWLRDPRAVDPKTAMPTLGLSLEQARDAAAYLYTQ